MKINFLIFLFLLATVLNGTVWIASVPIWHFPDEQAHFAQIAFFTEKGRNPQKNEKDLSEEIFISEVLLGTLRDKYGNNKFTFHPEYKIEYTDYYLGKYEASISALAKTSAKKNFIAQEASRYPLLYYIPASWIYRIFYDADLFVRVFTIRFWSLTLFLGTVVMAYFLGKLILGSKIQALSLSLLIGFQPMMVFANTGVNSDALGNFIFTSFIYLSAKVIIVGLHLKTLIFLIFLATLCLYTKPQFIIVFPILLLLLIFIHERNKSRSWKTRIFFVAFAFLFSALFIYIFREGPARILFKFSKNFDFMSLVKYSYEYTLTHTINEVLPWYWGIYKWLGVTYPRFVHRIINRIILLSLVGFIFWIIKIIRYQLFSDKRIQATIFLIIIGIVFFISISFYDWFLWHTTKFSLGVQGRYFFPIISINMLILLIGWKSLFSRWKKIEEWSLKILALLMVVLNFYAIFTILKIYYEIWPLSRLVAQISQYKPYFLKGGYFLTICFFYFIAMIVFLLEYVSYRENNQKN